nr:hypothetical protein [Tanacetum cinerariifolium]
MVITDKFSISYFISVKALDSRDGKPITCNECGGILRGEFCFPCNLKAKNSFIYDQDAYSFNDNSNNSTYLPQPQYENYLCNLCGNNSHDGYDCQQQFPFVYEREPSYNQNYDDNYYPHESPSFPCCDNCGGSHETFQCQPMDQNIDFSGSDQIQTLQYPKIHSPSQEKSEEHDQPEDSNELFQKLLEDLKELAEYKESLKKSSTKIATSNSNEEKEEPPQDSDIHQLIEECSTKVSEEQKQKVKNVMEQPTERGTRVEKSLQNFRVIHKSYTFLKDTSQISPVHAIAPILSKEEREHSLSMGYEHLSTKSEAESDKVTESSAKNLLPIPSECEVTSEDKSNDDESLPDEDVPAKEFKIYSNPLFDDEEINSDKLDPHCFNIEYDFVESLLNRDTFNNSSPKFVFFLKEFSELNAEIAETIIESLPSLHIPVQDDDSRREEIDIVTETDDVLPPSVENDDDSEEDIHFLEELLSDNSIHLIEDESSDSDHQDDSSFPLPPPEPPDAKIDFELDAENSVVVNDEFKCLDPRNEFDDYCSFMFVIRIFLPFLIHSKMFLSFLSAESEDTIFDPGKDYAQNIKNQLKTGQYQHKIGSLQQKPDQREIFSKKSSNEA